MKNLSIPLPNYGQYANFTAYKFVGNELLERLKNKSIEYFNTDCILNCLNDVIDNIVTFYDSLDTSWEMWKEVSLDCIAAHRESMRKYSDYYSALNLAISDYRFSFNSFDELTLDDVKSIVDSKIEIARKRL